jgi:uncharacterized membrane protein YhaH (DUF805 family)
MEWYRAVLKKYAVFDGRARRKEYWYFVLFNFLIALGLLIIGFILGFAIAGSASESLAIVIAIIPVSLYGFAMIIPSIAVTVRRLHDIDFSGWWYLISLVPGGSVVLFIFALLDTKPGPNKYGPDPKAGERLSSAPPPVAPQSSSQT